MLIIPLQLHLQQMWQPFLIAQSTCYTERPMALCHGWGAIDIRYSKTGKRAL